MSDTLVSVSRAAPVGACCSQGGLYELHRSPLHPVLAAVSGPAHHIEHLRDCRGEDVIQRRIAIDEGEARSAYIDDAVCVCAGYTSPAAQHKRGTLLASSGEPQATRLLTLSKRSLAARAPLKGRGS